ncbi:MAG: HAD family hydrolase [Chloroflexota bacterium]|nr:HAD family hydrolase [Chloroflexota bacterium]
MNRWVVLDVGETIIDETRVWTIWADMLGIPRLTFMAAFGATLAFGGEHRDTFDRFGVTAWRERWPEHEERYGGFLPEDLYADALPAIATLRAAGYRVAVIGNQPAIRTAQLRALGVDAEVIAMSEEMGFAKPAPEFFDRALELVGSPDAGSVAYVGDRVGNDVLPAAAAGMRAVWIRRGPWGVIEQLPDGTQPALVVDSLAELAARIGEAWPGLPADEGSR